MHECFSVIFAYSSSSLSYADISGILPAPKESFFPRTGTACLNFLFLSG